MQREMLERARTRLEGLLQLINDWLDMSRIQAGEILHRLQAVPLASCIDAALTGLDFSAQQKGVTLTREIASDLPDVQVDPDTFREVLSNLISNAIKYNRPEGFVRIRAAEREGWVVVDIEDSGFGIEEKEIPFVFEQFYRSKDKEVRRQEGTGLGLAIVDRIVRAHGGKIELKSEYGKGSTFSVYLNKAGQ
jgi:signal transduction histidine kinase